MTYYIVTYEIWVNGIATKWGDSTCSVTENADKNELGLNIRKHVSSETGCEPNQVRIIGVFKL